MRHSNNNNKRVAEFVCSMPLRAMRNMGIGCKVWIIILAVLVGTRMDPFQFSILANYPHFSPNFGTIPSSVGTRLASSRDSANRLRLASLILAPDFSGPESLAFDPEGRGPYTGVADGRILRWDGNGTWTRFAYTSHKWSKACIPRNPRSANIKLEHICGRPLGLRFDKKSGDLYIADAYFGLMVVGPEGGLATSLSSEAEDLPFKFTNDLDLDSHGFVYFTDTSSIYARRDFVLTGLAWDTSGRLLRYDTKTKETVILIKSLASPNGVSLSKDESFLIVAEAISTRLLRYWLKGPKAGTVDLFAVSPGHPDNVRVNEKGEFWVAMHCRRNSFLEFMGPKPWVRKLIASIPIPLAHVYSMMLASKPHAMIVHYDADGEILEVLEDDIGKQVKLVSEVQERNGSLWIGSVIMPHIAILNISST